VSHSTHNMFFGETAFPGNKILRLKHHTPYLTYTHSSEMIKSNAVKTKLLVQNQ